MKKYIITSLFLIYSILQSLSAVAPEPFSDSNLEQYGSNPNFKATVKLDDCSASRITLLDKELPFDLYITAAHCLHHNEPKDLYKEFLEYAFNLLLDEVKDFSNLSTFNVTTFVQNIANASTTDGISLEDNLKFFNGDQEFLVEDEESFDDEETLAEDQENPDVDPKLIEEIISDIEFVIKKLLASFEKGYITQFPSSVEQLKKMCETQMVIYKEIYDQYKSSEVSFIIHPSYLETRHFDFALFTDFQKTGKPAYPLFKDQPETLLGKQVTSVGIAPSTSDEDEREINSKKAFTSIIQYLKGHNYYGEAFMPSLNNTNNPYIGLITAGDSGGSMLIKNDSDNAYYLCGVISGHDQPNALEIQSVYTNIPAELKTSQIHQECEQGDPSSYCYGKENRWSTLDFDFINQAIEEFLLQANQNENKKEL